jgi:hypothetical protein
MAAPRTNGAPLALVPPLVTARGGKGGVVYRSDSAHIQCWTGLDIPVEINAQGLLTAYDSWSAVQTRGLPRLSDLIATDAAKADNDMLLLLKLSNDYIAVAQGADYIRRIGRDLRGRLLSEFNAQVGAVLKKIYDACLEQIEAVYCRQTIDFTGNSVCWEGLFLPLQADDRGNALLVMTYNVPLDDKADVLQMVLDRSPIGMIAAVPVATARPAP